VPACWPSARLITASAITRSLPSTSVRPTVSSRGTRFLPFDRAKRIRDNLRYPLLSREARLNSDQRYVTLPEEYAGQLMVFRPFENISYAIVLDGTNAIRVDDVLDHPDREL
jgi:hypothetical protein